MTEHRDPVVRGAARAIGEALADIERHFKPGVRLTLVARHEGFPERDMVVTNDTLEGAVEALKRRAAATPPASPPPPAAPPG